MTCQSCGLSIESGVKYCPECGARQAPGARRSRLRGARGRNPASRFRLINEEGDLAIEIPWNRLIRVGRHPSTDLTLVNPSVSRFHAELITTEDGCVVKDLDSSNGTFVNGVSVGELTLREGDELRFGSVAFKVEVSKPRRRKPKVPGTLAQPADRQPNPRLAHLTELATALARRLDRSAILDLLVRGALDATGADRASIAMVEGGDGEFATGVFHGRTGVPQGPPHVPRSIASHCLSERVAIITEAAGRDRRFSGNSIVTLGIRSALCAPIVGKTGKPVGVCYLDHTSDHDPFTSEDLSYLIALTGIAAAALERED